MAIAAAVAPPDAQTVLAHSAHSGRRCRLASLPTNARCAPSLCVAARGTDPTPQRPTRAASWPAPAVAESADRACPHTASAARPVWVGAGLWTNAFPRDGAPACRDRQAMAPGRHMAGDPRPTAWAPHGQPGRPTAPRVPHKPCVGLAGGAGLHEGTAWQLGFPLVGRVGTPPPDRGSPPIHGGAGGRSRPEPRPRGGARPLPGGPRRPARGRPPPDCAKTAQRSGPRAASTAPASSRQGPPLLSHLTRQHDGRLVAHLN